MIDLGKFCPDTGLMMTIIGAIIDAAKAAGESEADVLKRVNAHLAEAAMDATDDLLAKVLRDYPDAARNK
jgi:ribosomal 50S subunit-associated protein YjgA (DUF615 family)